MIQLLAEQFAMQDPPFTSEKVAFRRAAALSYNNCHAGDVLERLQQLCISPPLFLTCPRSPTPSAARPWDTQPHS